MSPILWNMEEQSLNITNLLMIQEKAGNARDYPYRDRKAAGCGGCGKAFDAPFLKKYRHIIEKVWCRECIEQ